VAPNDGAGACYRAAQILSRPVYSTDPSSVMCALAAEMRNVVIKKNSRDTVDSYKGSKDTLFVVSHSETLDPGLAHYIYTRGFRLLVFESQLGYKGYHKLYACHPFIRTSFPWTLPIVLSKNYKSIDKMSWVNISLTKAVRVSEVSCIPYLYAPFHLLGKRMEVYPMTDAVREVLDTSMVSIAKKKAESVTVWMKLCEGERGYWVVRGMYHPIPRLSSIIYIPGHGAFIPALRGKSVISAVEYSFVSLNSWITVDIDGSSYATRIGDMGDKELVIPIQSSCVRVQEKGCMSVTHWFETYDGPHLLNLSQRVLLSGVRYDLRVEGIQADVLGVFCEDGTVKYDKNVLYSSTDGPITPFVFLVGKEGKITHVSEILSGDGKYSRIRIRPIRDYSLYKLRFHEENRMVIAQDYRHYLVKDTVIGVCVVCRQKECMYVDLPLHKHSPGDEDLVWEPCPNPNPGIWGMFRRETASGVVGDFL